MTEKKTSCSKSKLTKLHRLLVNFSNKEKSEINMPTNRLGDGTDMYMRYEKVTSNDPEVRRLLNNHNLRKIFYGIDYAPLNVQ